MKSTDSTNLIETVIASGAASGYVTTIPTVQSTTGDGTISLTLGSPPECAISVAVGGKRPLMKDVNGVYNLLSSAAQSLQAWGVLPFNQDFAAAIGGYPQYAVCIDTSGNRWVSTADNNLTVPGTSGASWVSLFNGLLQLSSSSEQDITGFVRFTGAAGSNLQITNKAPDVPGESTGYNVPNTAWVDQYYATQAALASGVAAAESHADTVAATAQTNAQNYTKSVTGQFFGAQSSTTIVAPSWATRLEFILTGGGGGGASCWAAGTSLSTTNASGGGGGAGITTWGTASVSPGAAVFVVIGAGGAAQQSGGTSSLAIGGNTIATAGGGTPSVFAQSAASAGGATGAATGTSATWIPGGYGGDGQNGAMFFSGQGGASFWGGGGRNGSGGGIAGSAPGSGGGGAYDSTFANKQFSGGAGAPGILMYRWLP